MLGLLLLCIEWSFWRVRFLHLLVIWLLLCCCCCFWLRWSLDDHAGVMHRGISNTKMLALLILSGELKLSQSNSLSRSRTKRTRRNARTASSRLCLCRRPRVGNTPLSNQRDSVIPSHDRTVLTEVLRRGGWCQTEG